MREILFIVLMAGVFWCRHSLCSFFYFSCEKNGSGAGLTVAMLAVLVASAGAMGLTRFYILMGELEELCQVMPVISLTVAGEIIAVIGLWGVGKLWERRCC